MDFNESLYKKNIPIYTGNKKESKKKKKYNSTNKLIPISLLLLLLLFCFVYKNFSNKKNKNVRFNL